MGGGWGGDAFRKTAHDVLELTFVPVGFEGIAAAYEGADRTKAKEFADRWIATAKEVVEPKRDDIERSGAMYVAMQELMKKHGAMGISINCLGGFYGGHSQLTELYNRLKLTLIEEA